MNRRDEVKSGFGLAVMGNINVPTGDELAFTSDGALSGGVSVIADYRFNFGLRLASNLGVWIRPEHQFAGVKVGDMAQFGVAGEMYVVQRWGLSAVAEIYGYPSLSKYPDDATQIPAEVLLGLRWQTRQGITITIGGSFGAACGFGAPAIRVFNSVTWQPQSSVEQRETDTDILKDASKPVLDSVVRVLHERRDIRLVQIQVHTDVRRRDLRNLFLSEQQAKSARQYVIDHGVDPSRVEAIGHGHTHPLKNDHECLLPEKELTPQCLEAMAENRRVIVLIRLIGPPPPRPIADGQAGSVAILPTGEKQIPSGGVLPWCKVGAPSSGCVLPTQEAILKKETVLAKPNTILPNESTLPSGGTILPKGGSNLPRR